MTHTTRTALVTGVASGIGAATAAALVERGHRVLATSRNPEAIPESARIASVDYLRLDLADRDSILAIAGEASEVNILINNAGESQSGPFEELPPRRSKACSAPTSSVRCS